MDQKHENVMNYYEIFRVAAGIELVVHGAFEEVHLLGYRGATF